jgi:hypothetical protein
MSSRHEPGGVETDEVGATVNRTLKQAIEEPRADMERASLGCHVHSLDLCGSIGKPTKRSHSGATPQ